MTLLVAATGKSFAEEKAWEGTWSGTIGKSKVIACMDKVGGSQKDEYIGLYYYSKYLSPIKISPTNDPLRFEEISPDKKVTGHWLIKPAKSDVLEGEWISLNEKSLPINLTKIKTDNDYACGSNAFHAALEKPVNKEHGGIQELNGVKYQKIDIKLNKHNWARTINLIGQRDSIKSINQKLYNLLPINPFIESVDIEKGNRTLKQIADAFYSCQRGNIANQITGGITTDVTISVLNAKIISVEKHYTEDCRSDGRMPAWTEPHAFDLSNGSEINPWHWINNKGKVKTRVEDYFHVSDALNKLIVSSITGNGDCELSLYKNNKSYSIGINENGLIFTSLIGGYASACDQSFLVPYKKLQEFLTAQAKTDISSYFGKR